MKYEKSEGANRRAGEGRFNLEPWGLGLGTWNLEFGPWTLELGTSSLTCYRVCLMMPGRGLITMSAVLVCDTLPHWSTSQYLMVCTTFV